jgi:hypothetical protein
MTKAFGVSHPSVRPFARVNEANGPVRAKSDRKTHIFDDIFIYM